MTESRTAVVIEDDADIRELIELVLVQSGFTVHAAGDGLTGVELVREHSPEVITLDVGLPDIDGLEVTRRVRQFSDAYIVMLTARSEEADTLLGLDAGADDYLIKPFRPRELRARVAAMLRRPRAAAEAAAEPTAPAPAAAAPAAAPSGRGFTADEGTVYTHNGLTLAVETREVSLGGVELQLTRTEFDLLASLLASGRRVRSKADLVAELHADEYSVTGRVDEAEERAVEVHLGNLRRKLDDNPRTPQWIETVRGVGYRLAPARWNVPSIQ
ncbi:response regulator transcription factor [Arenivirga flava]|uniref:DNA-binding response regulator n=1 Tax=Arenivirga flava TaxID=1930060 RepID=A0AA37UP64_9MICO|nr:response regulator transcription factor [Arenivirga flava]GMA28581.1 hypothetical protein GCM10025874_18340 [Arenivirga flava]